MADRRPLIEGLQPEPEIDPNAERAFVYDTKAKPGKQPSSNPLAALLSASAPASATPTGRIALGARIRGDLFHALKRASFDRQLQGVEPNTLQEMIEEALIPWLKKHGYLP